MMRLPNWRALKNFFSRGNQVVSLPEFWALAPGHRTTKQTCSATGARDAIIVTRGGAGVADTLYWCAKNAPDAYNWEVIGAGGGPFVLVAGDKMTGDLTIDKTTPALLLVSDAGAAAKLRFFDDATLK